MGWKLNPYIGPQISQLQGMQFGLGFAGKEARKFLKSFRSGNFDQFLAPEIAAGAKRKQEIEHGYGMGSAALASAAGGHEASQFQALKDRAIAESEQQTGMDSINKMDMLYGRALGAYQNAYDSRRGAQMQRHAMILNALTQGSHYQQSPLWGLASAALGAAGGMFTGRYGR